MRILVGRHSGFCFGVQRAVSLAKRYADAGLPAWTYGAIIHNERVVEELAEQGVRPVERVDALQEGDTLILRAHGVPPQEEAACRARGVTVVDATCPFVKRIHRLVADTNGRAVFVAGQAHHPEVAGILGYAGAGARVLESVADAERVTPMQQAVIVAQTTMARAEYAAIVAALRERIAELEVHDTICDTTRQRQREAEQIAAR